MTRRDNMTDYVENLVVGSGFGGSVAAFRLAEAGLPVRVLERGRAFGPGDFPREPWEVARTIWDPSEGRQGLFDVWSFHGLDAVVAAGLGGGSLIYANVLIRKPEKWFVQYQPFSGGYESWPITRQQLDPHYDEVERMLGAQRFPLGAPGFEQVLKAKAMQEAANLLGRSGDFELPKQAVSFRPDPDAAPGLGVPLLPLDFANYHGKQRTTCTLCGQCDIGCNAGAKNTLDHTYLSAAAELGADICVRTEVQTIERDGNGYLVTYVVHPESHDDGSRHATNRLDPQRVRCARLFLAAGTLGTTYLLLKNRERLPGLSPTALGRRFSGNGDYLNVLKKAHHSDGSTRPLRAAHGPVITSALRTPDSVETNTGSARGSYIEDCGYPMLLNWLTEARYGLTSRPFLFALRRYWAQRTGNPSSQLGADLARVFGDGATASSSMPLLGMGRDVPDGVLSLNKRGYLAASWSTRTSKAYFDGLRQQMRAIADALNAEGLDDSLWAYFRRSITVHPVGGAPMGTNSNEGVCDHQGEVFGLNNLFVCDGSAMPGPVGPNPSLTIAAFSDRLATAVVQGRTRAPLVRERPATTGPTQP